MKCANKYCERAALPQMVVCAEHATPDAIRMALQRLVDIETDLKECARLERVRAGKAEAKLAEYLKGFWAPHKTPEECATWHDGCNCTPDVCVSLWETCNSMEEQIKKKIQTWFEEQHHVDGMSVYLMDQLAAILAGDE